METVYTIPGFATRKKLTVGVNKLLLAWSLLMIWSSRFGDPVLPPSTFWLVVSTWCGYIDGYMNQFGWTKLG